MKILVCLDDYNGMMYNNRRQSRDRNVLKDILRMTEKQTLCMSAASLSMFDGMKGAENITVAEPRDVKGEDVYYFAENIGLDRYSADISQIIVYRWNVIYPSDMKLDIDLSKWEMTDILDFKGYSHDYITKETYSK